MEIRFWRAVLIILLCSQVGYGQASLEVPETMTFAGIQLKLDNAVRDSIRKATDVLVKNNRFFRLSVERADAWFPFIERTLAENNVPDEFKYLVLQESKLVSDVISSSNAVGFWQFKKVTGIEMGLRVDDQIDERKNIVASTRAAAKYLARHNKTFNNWVYSLLGYYAGLTGARCCIKESYFGATEMELDGTTHKYIFTFLAHKLAYESAIHRNPNPPLRVIEYTECENKSLETIAMETNVPLEDLKFYNKWLATDVVPSDKDYTIFMPAKSTDGIGLAALDVKPGAEIDPNIKPYHKTIFFGLIKLPESTPPTEPTAEVLAQVTTGTYTSSAPLFFEWNGIKAIMAKKGDNISKLALQAEIDREDFLDYNDMRLFDLIVPGQVYYIKSKKRSAQVPYHIVKEGETLWEISQIHGIRMHHLLKKNKMDKPEKLKAGRKLWLRRTRPDHIGIEYLPVEAPKVDSSLLAKQSNSPQLGASDSLKTKIQQQIAIESADAKATNSKTAEEKEPVGNVQIFLGDPKPEEITPRLGFQTTKLEMGQTLYSLSKSLNTDLDSLKAWNNLENGGVKLGMNLYYKPLIEITKPKQENKEPTQKPKLDTAKPEKKPVLDTLQKKSAPVDSVKTQAKRIDSSAIKPILKSEVSKPDTKQVGTQAIAQLMPKPQPEPKKEKELSNPVTAKQEPSSSIEYIVKPGDNLFKIARENGVSVAKIQEWNNKQSQNVNIGEKLLLKK